MTIYVLANIIYAVLLYFLYPPHYCSYRISGTFDSDF